MPVQINEVIIRTVVDAPGGAGNNPTPSGCGTNDGTGAGNGGGTDSSELAEKILEIIREKQER